MAQPSAHAMCRCEAPNRHELFVDLRQIPMMLGRVLRGIVHERAEIRHHRAWSGAAEIALRRAHTAQPHSRSTCEGDSTIGANGSVGTLMTWGKTPDCAEPALRLSAVPADCTAFPDWVRS